MLNITGSSVSVLVVSNIVGSIAISVQKLPVRLGMLSLPKNTLNFR